MKNNQLIRRLIIAAVSISAVVLISTGYCLGFFRYAVFLFDKDFRNVYGIACKNTDIFSQRVASVEVNDDSIDVNLKLNLLTYLFTDYDADADDFYSALNIYKELSKQYADKKIYVRTGAVGSSYPVCVINDGYIEMSWTPKATCQNCSISFHEALEQIMLTDNIHKITYDYYLTDYRFDTVTEKLPTNNSVKSLAGYCAYTDNFSALTSFEGLKELELTFVGDDNIVSDMSFLNELPELESLTITADSMRIDFSEVSHNAVKFFTLYTDDNFQQSEHGLSEAFPNAEISVICEKKRLCHNIWLIN